MKAKSGLRMPKTPIFIFWTLSRTLKLPTLGIDYKAIPDPEPNLAEGSTHH